MPAATPATHPFPLGAHPGDGGVRFAVASSAAQAVEVCLIDEAGGERRVELPERTFGVWHGLVPGVLPGQRYGYRVHGPYQPRRGLRSNPAKLLVDPYARRIEGAVTDLTAALGHSGDPMADRRSAVDSRGAVPLSLVTAPVTDQAAADTGPPPEVPWEETVIYELHVRGFTRSHPEVPTEHRGTYLGLAHPAVVGYLVGLGVTAVELLPVHAFCDEPGLLRRRRHNYWGYSTLGFFAPHTGYASSPGREVEEFRTMVGALHAAGIEVLLDVVYNHTCEGPINGPTLCFRGLDAPAYYLLDDAGRDVDLTGCDNTLDTASPTVVRLVCDSLRYWATDMGVDGFRFDLASVLGRPGGQRFDPRAPLLTAVTTDPVLTGRKLIAEPWDATGDGYRVGGFGVAWSEWNGRYRDTARDFWRGAVGVDELASRLSGSSDLYATSGRRPWASVNFVTAHDGFTARDLVSYARKHNEANGESNLDGSDDNRSDNHGVEGPTSDSAVHGLRQRQVRNLLATLLLSTGTPMLLAGDERWRTQRGNNNPYCLDGPISWLDWSDRPEARALTAFVRRVLRLRRDGPALRQPEFFEGRVTPTGTPDLVWLRPDGQEMTLPDWADHRRRTLAMWIDGSDVRSRSHRGGLLTDVSWLLVLHAGTEPTGLRLPAAEYGRCYRLVLDTGTPDGVPAAAPPLRPRQVVTVPGRTLLLLRAER